jgi:hypothetical protein
MSSRCDKRELTQSLGVHACLHLHASTYLPHNFSYMVPNSLCNAVYAADLFFFFAAPIQRSDEWSMCRLTVVWGRCIINCKDSINQFYKAFVWPLLIEASFLSAERQGPRIGELCSLGLQSKCRRDGKVTRRSFTRNQTTHWMGPLEFRV